MRRLRAGERLGFGFPTSGPEEFSSIPLLVAQVCRKAQRYSTSALLLVCLRVCRLAFALANHCQLAKLEGPHYLDPLWLVRPSLFSPALEPRDRAVADRVAPCDVNQSLAPSSPR